MNKDKIKKLIKIGRENGWPSIKGVIFVIFGLYLTRTNVGTGRFETNILFGTLAYLFLALSGQFVVINLRESDKKKSKFALVMSLILYSIGFTLTLIIMAVFNLDIFILLLLIGLGLIWTGLWLFATSKDKEELIVKVSTSLIFCLGLIYGATLNQVVFPVAVLTFFFTFLFLDLSRVYIKDFRDAEDIVKIKKHRIRNIRNKMSTKKSVPPNKGIIKENLRKSAKTRISNPNSTESLKKSLLSQIFAIILSIVVLFNLYLVVLFGGVAYPTMYFWILLIFLAFLGLAAFFTKRSISKSVVPRRSGLLISFGMLVMLLAILLSS